MNLEKLSNLEKTGTLKQEPPNQAEVSALLQSGKARLKDVMNVKLAAESQFDLAYNAAHSLALAALRSHGYRAKNRYIVFQLLSETAELGPDVWRVLALCHNKRNLAEYEGYFEIDTRLLKDLIIATEKLLEKVTQLVAKNSTIK